MAKTTAPLLGFGASGQIGSTQVYGKWKGIGYARRYVVPANPNSTGQQTTRKAFTYLNGIWKFAGAYLTAPWSKYATGKPLTNRNAWLKTNMPLVRGQADNSAMLGSPGANGGVPADTIAAVDATGHVATVTMGVPAVPSGWTLTDSIAVLIPKETALPVTDYTTYEDHSGDAGGVVSVTAVAGDFIVTGWFAMTKADGTLAYGAAKNTTVTLA